MAIVYPGLASTVIPLFELSGELMVAYGRNVSKQNVNRYSRVTPVKSKVGNYLRFNPKDLARLPNLPQSTHWAPGTPRPTGFHNTLGFETIPFRTERENFGTTLDKEAVDIASFPIMKTHTAALGQRAMTYVAYRVCTALTTAANFDATHVFTATTAGGGFLSGGTTADPRIKNAFDYAARIIQKDTNGAVRLGQLSVLMNHVTAQKLASTREIREYVMQQVGSIEFIKMNGPNSGNDTYGLPKQLYGYNVVVEDLFYNTGNRGNATTDVSSVVFPDNKIVMFLADGDLEQPEGATSFSTVHRFAYEEFTLETKDDTWNRLVEMAAVINMDVQVVAPPTGCIITEVFS